MTQNDLNFAELFEHDLDAGVIVDAGQVVVRVNAAFTRLFGYSAEEALGQVLDGLIVPEDRRAEAATFTERVRCSGQLSLDTVRRCKDGSLVHVWVLAVPHRTAAGKHLVFVQYRDVTAQRRAEESVRANAAQLRAIFEQAPVGIVVTTPDAYILSANQVFADLVGYSHEQLLGMHASRFLHPDDVAEMRRLNEAVLRGELDRIQFEHRIVRPDGRMLWAMYQGCVLRNERGSITQIVGILSDITASREEKEQRDASLELFKSLIAHLRDGIIVADLDWRVAAINQAFFNLLWPGRTIAETLGMDLRELAAHCAEQTDDPAGFLRLAQQRMTELLPASDIVHFSEGRIFQRDYVPIRDAQGNLTGHLVDYHDLTQTFRLQEQLRQSQKMEAVGRLAGGIAHDFNNLLTVLQGHAAMLLEDASLLPSLREDVHEIMKASNKAANLTRQLLAYSRQQVMKPVILDPGEVISDLHRTLLRMIREDIRLKVNVDPDTPNVRADRTQFEQVLLNLAVNARDAMPHGGDLHIETKRCDFAEPRQERDFIMPPGSYALLRVSDTGEGIAEGVLPRIFDPFFTTKETGKGTGLGLATVYGIVKQSGGYIVVDSRPGDGSRFDIFLPAANGARHGPDAPA